MKNTRCIVPLGFLLAASAGCAADEPTSPAASGGSSGQAVGAAGTSGERALAGNGVAGRGGAPAITTAGRGATAGTNGSAGRGSSSGPLANAGRPAAESGSGAAGSSAAGSSGAGTAAPTGSDRPVPPLDCGPNGVAIENAGPPANRVNYVIIGDGYTEDTLDTTYIEHIEKAMEKRFSEVIGQPYGRYRKFVNICAIKLPSPSGPIGNGTTPLECSGDDQSRLARCNTQKTNAALAENLPESFEIDWKAVVLNNERWWNTGAVLMLWSGGNKDAAGAALHEGGHGFHQLADEYGGTNGNCEREYDEVNSTADAAMTAGKWDLWLGYDQSGATGMQRTLEGSRYCDSGQHRPSDNSMMNLLFGNDPDTSYNAVSREKMIMDIWRVVTPIDETVPKAGPLASPGPIEVHVVDPEVIHVDWSVDGEVVKANGGETLDVATLGLSAGKHTISARAYDTAGMEWVRYTSGTKWGRMNWARSQQTVEWSVDVP
ncbi:MAG: M64 family metallopeptidase [Polyangiales bacterium]